MSSPFLLVQLSDPHIGPAGYCLPGGIDTAAFLAQAVRALARLQPAAGAVIVTGDLADRGSAEDYAHLRQLLEPLQVPLYLIPGNHDDTGQLRKAFPHCAGLSPLPDPALAAFVLFATRIGAFRLVGLDTVVPRAPHGALCAARLAWLDRTLAEEPDTPTLLAMHHPPFDSGIRFMDGMGLLEGRDGLAAVLARHPQVERIACGHLHRGVARRFAHAVAMSAPSVAHQIALDLRPDGEAGFVYEPPGMLVHAWIGGALVTHAVPAGDHGPVRAFSD